MDTFFRDVRYGLRALRNSLGFAAAAVLIPAVAIGASTAMFSVFDALVLRPLPYRDAEQIVTITEPSRSSRSRGCNWLPWSWTTFVR